MWASPGYQLIVSVIMDNKNLQAHLLQVEGNEYLKQTISEQQDKMKSLQDTNTHLNTIITTHEKCMVHKAYKEYYKLMLFFDSLSVLKLIRRSKDSWVRSFEWVKDSFDYIFFKDSLSISLLIGKYLKDELAMINIQMICNVI